MAVHLLPAVCSVTGLHVCPAVGLLMSGLAVMVVWRVFRACRRHLRRPGRVSPWLAPALLLGAGGLLLALPPWGDIRLPVRFLYPALPGANEEKDTRCELPELSGVTLSAACPRLLPADGREEGRVNGR